MNRIVLIGNGFDLAHNLPTKYEDFINWYWEQRIVGLQNEHNNISKDAITNLKIKEDSYTWKGVYYELNRFASNWKDKFEYIKNNTDFCSIQKTSFFENICKSLEAKCWVDIENEYYNFLIEICNHKRYNYNVKNLNSELEFIRRKLSEYLTLIHTENQIKNIRDQIFSPIKLEDIAVEARELFYNFIESRLKFDDKDWLHLFISYHNKCNNLDNQIFLSDIQELKNRLINTSRQKDKEFIYKTFAPKEFFLPNKIMLLNFNYTKIADNYIPKKEAFIINHIHGDLTNSDGIIFGYGDELDDQYKYLKGLNNNEYLRFFKSTRYLESDNYRKMLSFIESAPFQVLIMGHSCGNSDRTLLNTLFEHNNCVSIKPYYYQKDNGSDNYLDLIQNISRNFTDMKKMRDRVVNKTYCEPLPQAQKNISQSN